MFDKFVSRMSKLALLFLLVGALAWAAESDRRNLIQTVSNVEVKTFAWILLSSELGVNAFVDDIDDDLLHIRTPGDLDFLESGSTVKQLFNTSDLYFSGTIQVSDGAKYRFTKVADPIFSGNLQLDDSESSEIVNVKSFEMSRDNSNIEPLKIWVSDGYLKQDYGGNSELTKFNEYGFADDRFHSISDLENEVSLAALNWINSESDAYSNYSKLRIVFKILCHSSKFIKNRNDYYDQITT